RCWWIRRGASWARTRRFRRRTCRSSSRSRRRIPASYSYQVTVPNVGMWFKWFTHKVGMDLVEVEYKSSPQAVQDMLAGRTDLFVNSITNYTEHLKAGKLKPLAFISSQMPPGFENVQNVRQILP